MSDSPDVSIVMAAYNAERHIDEAIQGILRQTYSSWELIIVDDCSRDGTYSLCQRYADREPGIRLFKTKNNCGALKARNFGLGLCRGRYIAIHDADDISEADRLKRQVSFMDSNPNISLSGSFTIVIDDEGKEKGRREFPVDPEDIRRNALKRNPFAHSTMLIKKNVLDKIGGYPERDVKIAEDYSLWLRLLSEYEGANLTDHLVKYRWFPSADKNSVRQKLINTIRAQRPWLFNRRLFSVQALGFHLAEYLMILLPQSVVMKWHESLELRKH